MSTQIPCPCPGLPHPDGDSITLREKLDFRSLTAIRWAIALSKQADPESSDAESLAILTEGYLREGVESWTLVDDKGKPIPVTKANIREHLLSNPLSATLVGDEADGLYSDVMLPLVMTASASSEPTPTDESTSPTSGSDSTTGSPSQSEDEDQFTPESFPTHLRPFSITTSQTDATVTTNGSLVGVSS